MKFLPISRAVVLENLIALADPGYRHKYYVDLTPTVAKGKGLLGGDDFETILVGGLGKGGKGYFALDISDPGSMSAENVLWEFPNAVSQDDTKRHRFFVQQAVGGKDQQSW